MLREGGIPGEGRPSGAMPGVYCSRCSRPNPDGARYCSHCGAPLIRATADRGYGPAQDRGWGGGTDRPGETTSVISPVLNLPSASKALTISTGRPL